MAKRTERKLPIVLATALIAGVLAAAAVAAPASALNVDHYVATTGSDTSDCQNPLAPCLTINYAISQAGEGDVINVEAGTYAEDVLVTKSLQFRGANVGVPGDAVRGAESIVKTFRTGSGATIDDIYGATPRDVTIDGFQIDPQGDAALEGATVQAGLIHLIGGTTTGTSVVNNIVTGAPAFYPTCTASVCDAPNQMAPMGISVGSGQVNISNNQVQNLRYAVRVSQRVGATALVAAINSNVVTGVSVQGISVGGATGVQQPGATITNNEIDAVGRASSPVGIVISNAGNTVTGNTVTDMARGASIVLCKKWDTRNNTIDDNVFVGAPLVVAVSTDGGQCATGSDGDSEGTGSWVVGGGRFDGFNANGNSFTGGSLGFASSASAGFSAVKPVTAGPIDITCNWWGNATGPTIASNPGGTGLQLSYSTSSGQPEFDYDPWEVAEDGACTGSVSIPTVGVGDAEGLQRDSAQGSVFIPVFLSKANTVPTVVEYYTVNGTATAGVDYLGLGSPANPRTLTIPAGVLQSQINVTIAPGTGGVEGDETFSVVIASVSGGDAVGGGSGEGVIIDQSALTAFNPVINVTNGTVIEGDDGQRVAKFYIQLSRPTASPVSFTYNTSDGTATSPSDYITKLPGTVNFLPGQISKTVDVLVNSNTTAQLDRSFSLDVTVIGGSPVEELNMVGVTTIVDDD